MARHESDREDLLREATALVERIELAPALNPQGDHITAGFRAGGELSIFFGADPVYQFNTAGQLRRAYCDGLLYKAICGRLVSLRRIRQRDEVQLLRHDLTDDELEAFLARMTEWLRELALRLDRREYHLVGQVPREADVLDRLRRWLADHRDYPIANSPRLS